jgi:hypothetical protein
MEICSVALAMRINAPRASYHLIMSEKTKTFMVRERERDTHKKREREGENELKTTTSKRQKKCNINSINLD